MIDVASIRADAAARPGDVVGLSKAQLAQLLDEVEAGQIARRELTMLATGPTVVGIGRVSVAG